MVADYVIVGAGSAGCVLAERLSADGARVVLLEAGPPDDLPWIHIPAGVLKLLDHPVVNWNYSTEPDAGGVNRRVHWPRGKTLGGTSSINGMLYVRGNPADYDGWAQRGCRGWRYEEVLPYFKKAETYRGRGEDEFRGRHGPLIVEDYRTILPLTHMFVEAAQTAGFAYRDDLNGRQQEGVGYSQMTRRHRFRASTARTYLAAARRRPNLEVITGAMATGLLFEDRRCVGVGYRRDGTAAVARAGREVILSGGAINSPHLLQVSGVGPPGHLRRIGVEVRHDLPGVGANLQDHYVIRVMHRVTDQLSINQLSRGPRLAHALWRYALWGDGALTFGVTSAQVFCRSRDGLESPDLQLLFTPASYDRSGFGKLEREAGMSVAICPVRPSSRGTIMAESADPLARPAIRPNYLAEEDDVRVLLAGLRHARRIFSEPALSRHSAGELEPGTGIDDQASLRDFATRMGNTIYHPVGTCQMGEGPSAVVDSRLRVHGLQGLRVIDASIMPALTTGNTNAPTIMIAEKGADMIREDNAG
jgi:choline dehydrogenase